MLRYLVGQVSGQSYAEYVHKNVFAPLGMTHSGFSAAEFAGHHASPYTRIDGKNIAIPLWDGQGSMMHTTAGDMARFVIALMNNGQYGDYQLLQPETVELMRQRTTRFKILFRGEQHIAIEIYTVVDWTDFLIGNSLLSQIEGFVREIGVKQVGDDPIGFNLHT